MPNQYIYGQTLQAETRQNSETYSRQRRGWRLTPGIYCRRGRVMTLHAIPLGERGIDRPTGMEVSL